ncbi:MAG: hypothetical protein ABUL46_06265, partial [Chitinophaga rupis]
MNQLPSSRTARLAWLPTAFLAGLLAPRLACFSASHPARLAVSRLTGLLAACLLVFALPPLARSQSAPPAIATVGQPLPAWQQGYLDLHHINTGRGNAAFYVLPDGTTILFDAGELDPTSPRTTSKRNTPIRPNDSKRPYEWIASYIRQVAPQKESTVIDYGIISHFHDDHFGSWYPAAPLSDDRKFALTGILGVANTFPLHNLLTRDYNYPVNPKVTLQRLSPDDHFVKTWTNYLAFLQARKDKGLVNEFLRAGSSTQIHLVHQPGTYPGFYVQNVKSNGWIWAPKSVGAVSSERQTGKAHLAGSSEAGNNSSFNRDSTVEQHFPPIDTADRKTWPDENALSNVLVIHYGPFAYYTGGDCPGNVFLGDAPWRDVETSIARAVGPVDIATMDHHGNRDAVNEFMVKTLHPSVWIEQVWTADHPGHETLIRIMSPYLYPDHRDLFA